MKTKTCGECRFHDKDDQCSFVGFTRPANLSACRNFEPKPTNGDVIRQGGDYALAQFRSAHRCDVCAYAAPIDTAPACLRPEGESCFDGMLAWLSAPSESEVENV